MLHTPLIYYFLNYFSYVTSTALHILDYLSNHFSEHLPFPVICSLLKFMRETGIRTRLRWRGEKVWILTEHGCRNREHGEETTNCTINLFLLFPKKNWQYRLVVNIPILIASCSDTPTTQDLRSMLHNTSMFSLSC